MNGSDPETPATGEGAEPTADDTEVGPESPDSPVPTATESPSSDPPSSPAAVSPFDRVAVLDGRDRVRLGVVVVTTFALLARLVALGARPAHWDEARVAYWADFARDGGSFAYRSIIHGPFIQHADRWLFELFGTTDFLMRLPVALVGGLLPLAALLYRNHLRDEETVGLALLLSFNPVLLYYSRFMRSDVLVATFMFVAFGMVVRLLDSRKPRYLYGVAAFIALGVASKENSIIYVLTWLGAGGLLLDRALDRPGSDSTGTGRVVAWASHLRERARTLTHPSERHRLVGYGLHVVGALALFGVVWLFMFAPRGDGLNGLLTNPSSTPTVGLWDAVGDPNQWLPLVDATVSQFSDQYLGWEAKAGDLTYVDYQNRLGDSISLGLLGTSAATTLLAVSGFLRERYGVGDGRILVFFMFFAAAASIVGYPLGLSIGGGWKWGNVHVLVPLAIPAAVGLGTVYRWGLDAYADGDSIDVGLTAFIALVITGLLVTSGMTHVYLNPQHESNALVQFGQPHDDLQPVVEELREAAPGPGTDVLIFGNTSDQYSFVGASSNAWQVAPICTDLELFLPMHWYLASTDATGTCVSDIDTLADVAQPERVPIVITRMRTDPDPSGLLEQRYTHLGNFSLRYTEDAIPTMKVYVRDDLATDS